MSKHLKGATRFGPVAATVTGVVVVAYLNWGFLTSGLRRYQGSDGDGRLTTWITSHWWEPFQFSTNFRDMGIFFPVPSTLGYSDTLFITGVVTYPLGQLGLETPVILQLFYVALAGLGYACAVLFMRRGPGASWWISILTACLVVAPSGLVTAAVHPQLLYWQLFPVIMLMALALSPRKPLRMRVVSAAGLGLIIGALTYSAPSIGWLLIASLIMATLLIVIASFVDHSFSLRQVTSTAWPALMAFLALLLWTPLLLATYLPTLMTAGDRIAEDYERFVLLPADIVTVGPGNVVWGVSHSLLGDSSPAMRVGEAGFGPTPILLLLCLLAFVVASIRLRSSTPWSRIGWACLGVGFILLLMPVQFGDFLLWEWLWHIPGATSTRAIGRIHLAAALWMAMGLGIMVSQWQAKKQWTWRGIVTGSLIGLVLLAEQIGIVSPQQHDAERNQLLANVGPPPADCESFLLTSSLLPQDSSVVSSVDAQVVGRLWALPTWNGYSGAAPKGWGLIPQTEMYWADAGYWKDSYRLDNPCGLDLENLRWVSADIMGNRIDTARRAWLVANGSQL